MTVPQTAPKVCHPERRAKPGVEGSSHQFDCEDPVHAKILRLASLAQDDKLRTIGYLSGRLPRRFAPRNDVEISGRSFRIKNPPVPRNRGKFALWGEEMTYFRDSSTATETVMPTCKKFKKDKAVQRNNSSLILIKKEDTDPLSFPYRRSNSTRFAILSEICLWFRNVFSGYRSQHFWIS